MPTPESTRLIRIASSADVQTYLASRWSASWPSTTLSRTRHEATHLRRAVREFAKNTLLVADWNLPPRNVRELRTQDIPPLLVDAPEPALRGILGLPDNS